MTNRETDYFSDFDPTDPLDGVDHTYVCETVFSELTDTGTLAEALLYERDHQFYFDQKTYGTLFEVGNYLIPLNEEGERSNEDMRLKIFLSGTIVALKTMDTLCASIGLDPEAFRQAWHANGFVKVVNINAEVFKDKTNKEKYEAIGDGIIAGGIDFLDRMKPEYQKLINDITDVHESIAEPNLLKASYGYVLGSAMQTLSRVLIEIKAGELAREDDADRGVEYLLEESIPVELASDDDIAEAVDNNLFYNDETGVEAFLGQNIEYLLDRDDELVETMQRLALVQYPNELGNGSLDQNGEAFFMGGVLALVFGEEHCSAVNVGFEQANMRWRKDAVHSRLNRIEFVPEERMPDVDKKVMGVLLSTELGVVMHGLLDKISYHLDHDEDEAVAFKNGVQYVLESYKKAVRACINAKISLRVKLATASMDEELAELLDDE